MRPVDDAHSSAANLAEDLVVIAEARRGILWAKDTPNERFVCEVFLQLVFELRMAGKDFLSIWSLSCFTSIEIAGDDFAYPFFTAYSFVMA